MAKIQHDSETPAVGQQVIVACAFIHQQIDGVEKVFLAKRATTKKFFPGVFEIPGGHIDFGEDIVDGLKREVREELGVEIQVGDPFGVFSFMNEIKGAHGVEVAYFAHFVDEVPVIKLEPADHSEWAWFSEDEYDTFSAGRDDPNDHEIGLVIRGFAILRGDQLKS